MRTQDVLLVAAGLTVVGLAGYLVWQAIQPVAACTPEGAERTTLCPDGSVIVSQICQDGAWAPTNASCPSEPPPPPPPTDGLLRVQLEPAVAAMLGVNNEDTGVDGVASGLWGIDWISLPAGNYSLDAMCCDPDYGSYVIQRHPFVVQAGYITEIIIDTATWVPTVNLKLME
ncbi:MAG: hypothetical protein JW880_05170 [Candidatus Thermoplasmatota archaeon]|nr:hypothetical protein [Candidatus Thermoplasmatota archaeon]